MADISGSTAIVTGGSGGIGAEIVRRFRRDGANVAIVDYTPADVKAFQAEPGGGQVWYFPCDLTQPDQIEATCTEILAKCGQVSVLVNNAGGSGPYKAHTLEATADEIWSRVIELNLSGTFRMCRALAPQMRTAKYGRIINISSVVRRGVTEPGAVGAIYPYVVSKAAIAALTRQLALELGPDGITVNAISPGAILAGPDARVTKIVMAQSAEHRAMICANIPMRRFGDGNDIAAMVAFLASSESGYVTGQTINVDGGL